MTGDKRHRGCQCTMGHRNACIGRNRDCGRHTRHNLKLDPCGRDGFCLFSTAAEDKWVAPFESNDHMSLFRTFNKQSIDIGLILILSASPSTHINTLCRRWSIL